MNHFPHQLHYLFIKSSGNLSGSVVGVVKAVHDLLLVLNRHLHAVLDQTQQLLPVPVAISQQLLELVKPSVELRHLVVVLVWRLHVVDIDRFELVVTVRARVASPCPS